MSELRFASIGLVLAEGDPYAKWFREALDQVGLVYHVVSKNALTDPRNHQVLLFAGYDSLSEDAAQVVTDVIGRGGAVVCAGSTWGLGAALGVADLDRPRFSQAYVAAPQDECPFWPEGASRAKFLGGTRVEATGSEVVLSTQRGEVALARRGRNWYMAPHLGQTMALMLMGHSVENDGIGPDDGTAVLEDGVLRAEDGTNLSFEDDRTKLEGANTSIFLEPHVDTLREVWIGAVLQAVESTGFRCAILWPWPENAPAVACTSIECEDHATEHVLEMHQRLSKHGMPAAWLVAHPGYPSEVYRAFRKWEDEVALLFKYDDQRADDVLRLQYLAISRSSVTPRMVSVRCRDGRWLGLDRFYRAAENVGVKLSLNKGGRQPGTTGFLFGTCHPFFPVLSGNSHSRTAEMPYSILQPGIVAPYASYAPIVEQVRAHNGCLHFAMNVASIHDQRLALGLQELLQVVRRAGFLRLTPDAVYQHDKARRSLRVETHEGALAFISDTEVEGITVLVSGPPVAFRIQGKLKSPSTVKRHGAELNPVVFDLEQKARLEVLLEPALEEVA